MTTDLHGTLTASNHRRRDAARHLLHPSCLKGSLRLSQVPRRVLGNSLLAGAQTSVTAAIALPLVQLSPWSHLIGYAALGTLVPLFGRFAPAGRRNRIYLYCALLQVLAVLAMSLAGWLGASQIQLLLLLALAAGVFTFLAATGRFGPPGPLIFLFAAGAAIAPGLSGAAVVERSLATALVAALGWLVCLLSESLRRHPSPEAPLPSDPQRPLGDRLGAGLRATVATAVAVALAHALGAQHPAWAAMGALVVVQGSGLNLGMHRALQRMAGTVIGSALAYAVLQHTPSVWVVILAVVALQMATELVIGFNYGFGQTFVTAMALLMTYLASHGAAGPEMAPERVLDTLLGASVGLAVVVLLSTLEDRRLLAAQHHGATG